MGTAAGELGDVVGVGVGVDAGLDVEAVVVVELGVGTVGVDLDMEPDTDAVEAGTGVDVVAAFEAADAALDTTTALAIGRAGVTLGIAGNALVALEDDMVGVGAIELFAESSLPQPTKIIDSATPPHKFQDCKFDIVIPSRGCSRRLFHLGCNLAVRRGSALTIASRFGLLQDEHVATCRQSSSAADSFGRMMSNESMFTAWSTVIGFWFARSAKTRRPAILDGLAVL